MAIFNGNNRYVVVLNGTRYVDKYTLPKLSDNWIQASAATGTWNNPSYTLSFNKLIWDVGGHIEYKYGSDAEWTVLSAYQSTFAAPANVRCMQVQAAGTGFYNSSTFNSGNFTNLTTSTPTISVDASEMTMTIHNTSSALPIEISTSCTGHSITYSDTITAGASKVVDYSTWISTTCATNGYTIALSGTANNSDVSSHGDVLKSNSVDISASLSKQQLTDTLAVNSTDTWISHYIKVTHSAVPSGVTPILHYKLGNTDELTSSSWSTDGSISFTTANCKTITYYTSADKRYNSSSSTTIAANPDSPAIQLTVCTDTRVLSMYNPSSYSQYLSLTGTVCGTSFDYSRTINPKTTSTQNYLIPETPCASIGQLAQFNGHGTNHIVCTSYSEDLVGNDIDTNTVNFEKKKLNSFDSFSPLTAPHLIHGGQSADWLQATYSYSPEGNVKVMGHEVPLGSSCDFISSPAGQTQSFYLSNLSGVLLISVCGNASALNCSSLDIIGDLQACLYSTDYYDSDSRSMGKLSYIGSSSYGLRISSVSDSIDGKVLFSSEWRGGGAPYEYYRFFIKNDYMNHSTLNMLATVCYTYNNGSQWYTESQSSVTLCGSLYSYVAPLSSDGGSTEVDTINTLTIIIESGSHGVSPQRVVFNDIPVVHPPETIAFVPDASSDTVGEIGISISGATSIDISGTQSFSVERGTTIIVYARNGAYFTDPSGTSHYSTSEEQMQYDTMTVSATYTVTANMTFTYHKN